VQAHSLRLLIAWPVAATALLIANRAMADDNDPAAIEQRLKALETTAERKTLLSEPARNTRAAIKRVLDARAAGDAAHAVELAALASDWAQLAANVVRAVELEQQLVAEQTRLTELEQQRRRTETLLEATIAQRERTREELNRVIAQKSDKSDKSDKPDKSDKSDKSPSSPPKANRSVAAAKPTASSVKASTASPASAKGPVKP
jgi:hypothetical protein